METEQTLSGRGPEGPAGEGEGRQEPIVIDDVRVLVRTLPLWRGNYGGILQAAALQHAIRGLGVSVLTDVSERLPPLRAGRRLLSKALSGLLRRPIGYMAKAVASNTKLEAFVRTHVSTTRVFAADFLLRRRLVRRFDLLITGSDQVWRPEYGDVNSYLFDFSRSQDRQVLASYAASFGVDQPNLEWCAPIARRLERISVREESAVEFVSKHWNLGSSRHPDPTLLLDADTYREWIASGMETRMPQQPTVFAYVLDVSESKARLVARCAQLLNLEADVFEADPRLFGSRVTERPSVEEWLQRIEGSEFVITDSFHGCVFAIIFRRPFVVIANEERGLARFASLLSVFGLEDRLLSGSLDAIDSDQFRALVHDTIDWESVHETVKAERRSGLFYLERLISEAAVLKNSASRPTMNSADGKSR